MKIGTWLLSLVTPWLAKILTALGFSVVTVVGFNLAINAVKDQLVSSVNQLPADMLNVFLLAGGGVALGMVTGAVATRLLLWQIKNATRILGMNPQ